MMSLIPSIKAYLDETLSAGRVAHILRVADTARQLAEQHGVEGDRAYLAALLHDLAREVPGKKLLEACKEREVAIFEIDELNPLPRLHGTLASLWAQERFGVEDPEILAAISSHTLGRVGMSPLEMVVFLSDYTEPGRPDHNGLEEVRAAAPEDLALATRLAMDYTIRYLVDKRRSLHPQMVEARNWILAHADAGVSKASIR